jgi:uncharacterized membrane protein YqiK
VRAKAEAKRAKAGAEDTAQARIPEAVASADNVPAAFFSEKEQKLLKSGALHGRDAEKLPDATSKAALASFIQGNEEFQIKVRQAMEMDKLLRQRTRNAKERTPSVDEIPMPNTIGSM